MKPLTILPLAFLAFLGFAAPLAASQTRVDSTGGLSLVMTDEAVAINPYIYSNPAGLGILPIQNRFDYNLEWLREGVANSNQVIHIYGTYNDLANSKFYYQGLTWNLTDRWAVQLDGDFFNDEGANFNYNLESADNDRVRGYFRTSYNFGILVLGASVIPQQYNQTFNFYTANPNPSTNIGFASGTGSDNITTASGGFLLCFPGDADPKQSRLELGGTFGSEIGDYTQTDQFSLNYLGSPFNLTETFTDPSNFNGQLQVFYEVPGSFEGALIGQYSQYSVDSTILSSDPTNFKSISTYNSNNTNTYSGTGTFKITSPLSSSLNFKSGGAFNLQSQNQALFKSDGSPLNDDGVNTWDSQVGVGLEGPGKFTVGMQAEATGANGQVSTSGLNYNVNYFAYKFSFGGENWMSTNWALRLGIVVENDLNMGNIPYPTLYYPVAGDSRILATTITAGVGYQDDHLKVDGMIWTGLPTIYGSDSNEFATQAGGQFALGILF